MTVRQIGSAVGVPHRTIARYLNNAGVKMRSQGEPHDSRLDDVDRLKALYASGLGSPQIAEIFGVTSRTAYVWLVRAGVEMRSVGAEKGHSRNTEEMRRKASIARLGKYSGPDHYNWKGGVVRTDLDRNRYPSKLWSRRVKERDGYKCRECGCDNGTLHSHHIKRWMDYPELRYDVDNGITLCEPCHQKAHGKGFVFPWLRHAKSSTSALPRNAGEDIV